MRIDGIDKGIIKMTEPVFNDAATNQLKAAYEAAYKLKSDQFEEIWLLISAAVQAHADYRVTDRIGYDASIYAAFNGSEAIAAFVAAGGKFSDRPEMRKKYEEVAAQKGTETKKAYEEAIKKQDAAAATIKPRARSRDDR